MMRSMREAVQRAAAHVEALPTAPLVLSMTALVLILYPAPFNLSEQLLLPVFAGALLVLPALRQRVTPWLLVLMTMTATMILFWSGLDNHQYLITYWCIACVLAVQADATEDVLRWNARWLIGLCFFFGTFTKLIWGQFLDGSFFSYQFLIDARLEHAAVLFGGLQLEDLQRNRELVGMLLAAPPTAEATLITSQQLIVASQILSVIILVVEALLAAVFLIPRLGRLHQLRDLVLFFFLLTTYPFAPVPGFAAILSVMGLAQCPVDRPKTRLTYLVFFLLIPLIVRLPSKIPHLTAFLLGQP